MSIERRPKIEELEKAKLPTEVLDQMRGYGKFFDEVIVGNHDPDKLNLGFVIGPAGVGKSIVLSQIMVNMIQSVKLQQIAENAEVRSIDGKVIARGKERHFDHFAFEDSLTEMMRRNEIKTSWGGFSIEDFRLASEDLAKRLAITRVMQASLHPEQDTTVVSDLVGLTEQRGGLVISTQDYDNAWLIVILPDREGKVMKRAKELRKALFTGTKDEFIHKSDEFHIRFDKGLSDEEIEGLKMRMGNETSVDRVNQSLSEATFRVKPELMAQGCPNFSKKSFLQDPALMSDVLYFYASYLILDRWRFPEERVFIVENKLVDGEINYYLGLLDKFRRFKMSLGS